MYDLQKFDMIPDIEDMDSYTIFVPVNAAWSSYTGSVVCVKSS